MRPQRLLRTLIIIALLLGGGLTFRAFLYTETVHPNVLVILIDTLRADHLGINGYERDTTPVLDHFGRENVNFSHAQSAASWTPPSVASIFTGIYASVHGHMPLRSETSYGKRFTKLDDSFVTMAEQFKDAGYATAAISANPMVGERYGFRQGFDLFISPGRERADKVNRRVKKYLSDLRPKDKPFYLYLHYMDPHDPYEPPSPWNEMYQGALQSRDYPPEQVALMSQYDGEIRYLDTKIGELFEWLKQEGLYADLQIFILSDHGEQFMERGYQGHADRVYAEEVHIPFMYKVNREKGTKDLVVSAVDLYPTVLDAAGIPLSHEVHGFSLLTQIDKRKHTPVMAEIIRHVNQKAFVTPERVKLIREFAMADGLLALGEISPLEERVFDLKKDPFEGAPLDNPALQKTLRDEFIKFYRESLKLKGNYKVGETELDEKGLEQLRTLGYL